MTDRPSKPRVRALPGWSDALVPALAVIGLVPLALLTLFSVDRAEHAVRSQADAGLAASATLAAELVEQQMQGVLDLVVSYAQRPNLRDALASGDVAAARPHLEDLLAARPGIAAVFVSRPDGVLADIVPEAADAVGKDFSYRDWYVGLTERRSPYLSEAYHTIARGQPRVVAAGSPVHDAEGRIVALLVAAYSTESISTFTERVAEAQGVALTITDQRGHLLAAPYDPTHALRSVREDPRVEMALAGRTGHLALEGADGTQLSAYAPVAALGWAVLAEEPESVALAALGPLERTLYVGGSVLGIGYVGVLGALHVALRGRRAAATELEFSERRLQALIDHAGAVITVRDVDGRYILVNRRFEQLSGRTLANVRQRRSTEVWSSEHASEYDRHDQAALAASEPLRFEERVQREDGDRTFLSVRFALRDAAGVAYATACISTDITEMKRTERELELAHAHAMSASRLKSEFLANMSHEIRTPLNGVIGMASLLVGTDLHPSQRAMAETIRSSGEGLLRVINDILDFSKIEAGHLDIETVDLDVRTLAEEVVELFAGAAQNKGVELALDVTPAGPILASGDPGRIRQVLSNLVGNAIKFTDVGEVVVRMNVTEHHLRAEVRDTGIGVSEDDRERLFAAFVQADPSTTRRYGGTGLGLTICRQLVELMGGTIGVDSELGRGSRFFFDLPLGPALAQAPEGRPVVPYATGLRVLVVDDNATNRVILKGSLEAWGMKAECATNGAEALAMLRASRKEGAPFALALLDFQMPTMSGLALAQSIRDERTLSTTRLVLLTSTAPRGTAREARDAGISAVLQKPVRQSQLYDTITGVLGVAPTPVPPVITRRRRSTPSALSHGYALVVEDNLVNQQVVVGYLKRLGYYADVASNGLEALESLATRPYDLILMDCQMPQMDGFEATMAIRRNEATGSRRTPIIALTAHAMQGDAEKCRAAGMDDYLAKPLREDDLRTLLTRWLPMPGAFAPEAADAEPKRPAPPEAVLDSATLDALGALEGETGGSLLAELVPMFLADASERLAALRDADIAAVPAIAHALVGSSANLGATALVRVAREVEELGRAGDRPGVLRALERLAPELERVRDALQAVVEKK